MNKDLFYEKQSCRLCSSKNLSKVLPLKPTPIGDDYQKIFDKNIDFFELSLNQCNDCFFVQLSNVIDREIVYGDYLYVTTTSSGLPQHFKNLVDILFKKKIISNKSKILEIGSNDGTLLNYFQAKGCEVLGVDPAKDLVSSLKNNFDTITKVFNYDLSKNILTEHEQFDLVIANNVIANIDDLNDTFKAIHLLLKDNGFFVMETFSLYGVIRNNLIDSIYHEHLSYFTIQGLKSFATKFNLKLYNAEHLNVKGGSIRLFFKKTLENITVNSKTVKSVDEENKVNLNSKNLFKKIEEKNFYNRTELIKFFDIEKRKKMSFAGYGASVATTALMYYYGLYDYIEYLFDDEIKRHNLYSPGTGIKVLHPDQLLKIMPNYVVIFAWRYSEIIIKKNSKYINKGGKFIIPLTNFKII